ncbi:hypothetical protein SAMN05216167_1404 [Spirosoma endophyticum]|uniref:Uncharacterized protein n=1 Tax=Spirosoma endophyticum TaxID=662367 RepID=A0A1I2HCM2_9BACT|nr:hypothetical protein SAMN05216167_1404 [Spirosoma endophyticum]
MYLVFSKYKYWSFIEYKYFQVTSSLKWASYFRQDVKISQAVNPTAS